MNKLRIEPTSQESAGLDPVDTGVVQTAASLAQEGVAPDLTLQPKLRPNQDLIPALLDALARVAPAVHSQFMLLPFGPIPAYAMDDQASPWWDSEEAMTRADQLIEALYEADPHCYPTPEGPFLPPGTAVSALKEAPTNVDGALGDRDYTLPADLAGVWITVDNISVHVVRHSVPGSIPGVTVNLYPLGVEMDDPLGSATAYLDEAKALQDELDPVDIDYSRAGINAAPRTSDIGYEAWVRIQDQKLNGEDARLILTDAILAELKQDRVFNEHILISIMKDPRPELVIAAMTWAASESSPISHCRETDLLCQALEAVFEDASRCFDRHPEWLPAAKVAAACYYKRAGVFPSEWATPAEQTVLRAVRAALNIG